MKKMITLGLALLFAMTLTACGEASTRPAETTTAPETIPETTLAPETTEPVPTEPAIVYTPVTLDELEVLLGLADDEVAEDLGGGEENWAADQSTYIGRIYHVSLMDRKVKAFTSCDNLRNVASVSAWITDGTTEVTEEEVQFWVETLNEYAGSEPTFSESAESGSRNWKWKKDKNFITLRHLGDIVTIDMLPAIGKIK